MFVSIPGPVLCASQAERRLNGNLETVVLEALQDPGAYRHCREIALMKWITKERKSISPPGIDTPTSCRFGILRAPVQ